MLRSSDARKESMPGVRSAYPALVFLAVERNRKRSQFLAPKITVEALFQSRRVVREFLSTLRETERSAKTGGRPFRREHIALYFAERGRRLGNLSIRVKNRIVRIFPALLQ